uniref:Ig-like domain-containing protein n=1 Tax=Ursus americanus TaxID=9643 RepID=A0A452REB3_URSAM
MTPGNGRPWLPVALLLLQVPGCSSLSGPNSTMGTVGGSLSVQCRYKEKFRETAKYWCKTPCLRDIVVTKEADREVRTGRVSIRDHRADLTFTVTLENLTEDDAGTYRCGMDTSGLPGYMIDLTFRVVVSVSPGELCTPLPQHVVTACHRVPHRSLLSNIYFLLLVFLEVPVLLSMLSAVLWVNRPQGSW